MGKKTDEIAQELITHKFSGNETLEDLSKIFRKVMRKHHIYQTSPSYNEEGKEVGRIGNRFEWTLYETVWQDSIKRWLDFYISWKIKS